MAPSLTGQIFLTSFPIPNIQISKTNFFESTKEVIPGLSGGVSEVVIWYQPDDLHLMSWQFAHIEKSQI